ncbi:hypothetical protein H6F67_26830 [Microcoleus sp. FACHB-1515]|uniref:hypothetical protein n=1 Tax=Cyanophyceae TaxID=3028117 RepID=UPI001681DE49|nr:hypothetical protein [Microcoleus sp. FACHB-1515]MBD2093460.1 hypothetical protein [Microcoleus sp. FACHB-1515]
MTGAFGIAGTAIVNLPPSEAELMAQIQQPLLPDIHQRYRELREKLQADILTDPEHQELLTLTDTVEQADSQSPPTAHHLSADAAGVASRLEAAAWLGVAARVCLDAISQQTYARSQETTYRNGEGEMITQSFK